MAVTHVDTPIFQSAYHVAWLDVLSMHWISILIDGTKGTFSFILSFERLAATRALFNPMTFLFTSKTYPCMAKR